MKVIRHGEEHDPWGRPPEPFETIARRYIAQHDLIAPGLRAGTKLGALAFMVKMMLTRAPDLDRWERERGHPILRGSLCSPKTVVTGAKQQSRRSFSFCRLPVFVDPLTPGPAQLMSVADGERSTIGATQRLNRQRR